ncbi:hypothetical protein CDAR_600981 [Caerostris darwini]|uniref:Uncharacterized protein n=1 Tax=Caerostris darwini TaxID=1538125 RepID=A0AAV4X375_9ARAC|nr:hypothetical protein CDAR_288041 [Caerostris darwini]GIY89706.1 hypothetical protein CDAR_600981 [Caerostris darwini]
MKDLRHTAQNRNVVIGNQCTLGNYMESLSTFYLSWEIDGLLRNSRHYHSPWGTLSSLPGFLFDRQYGWGVPSGSFQTSHSQIQRQIEGFSLKRCTGFVLIWIGCTSFWFMLIDCFGNLLWFSYSVWPGGSISHILSDCFSVSNWVGLFERSPRDF